jgi:hypothetical protein
MLESCIRELKIEGEGRKNKDSYIYKGLKRPAFVKSKYPEKNGDTHTGSNGIHEVCCPCV